MRDDLYKTVPPTSNWRRVLKLACDRADRAEVQAALGNTIRKDVLSRLDSKWLARLKLEINQPCGDLFQHNPRLGKIQALQKLATTQAERQLCDIAQGLWCRDKPADLFNQAMRELCRHSIDAGIEHVGALIRGQASAREAGGAMKELRLIAVGLAFDEPRTKIRRVPKDDRSLLEQHLELFV